METPREVSPPPATIVPLAPAVDAPGKSLRRLALGLFALAIAVVTLFVLTVGVAVLTADVY